MFASPSTGPVTDAARPRPGFSDIAGAGGVDDERRPKNVLGDQGEDGTFSDFGESERVEERFFVRVGIDGEELRRRNGAGGCGGGLGVTNLSAGFIVLTLLLAMELIEALR